VTRFIANNVMNLVTPKATAKHELLFNKSDLGLLNKNSRLAAALGVTKFTTVIAMNLVTLCCATKVRLRSTNPPLVTLCCAAYV